MEGSLPGGRPARPHCPPGHRVQCCVLTAVSAAVSGPLLSPACGRRLPEVECPGALRPTPTHRWPLSVGRPALGLGRFPTPSGCGAVALTSITEVDSQEALHCAPRRVQGGAPQHLQRSSVKVKQNSGFGHLSIGHVHSQRMPQTKSLQPWSTRGGAGGLQDDT